jgi:hypothetical protein
MSLQYNEIKTLIVDAIMLSNAKTEGQFKVIDTKLDAITQRLDKINGTVANHEKRINDHDIIITDYVNHLKDTEIIQGKIRIMEDTQLTSKSIKKWVIGSIAIISVLLGIAMAIIELTSK